MAGHSRRRWVLRRGARVLAALLATAGYAAGISGVLPALAEAIESDGHAVCSMAMRCHVTGLHDNCCCAPPTQAPSRAGEAGLRAASCALPDDNGAPGTVILPVHTGTSTLAPAPPLQADQGLPAATFAAHSIPPQPLDPVPRRA
jgi:hypothetical protein